MTVVSHDLMRPVSALRGVGPRIGALLSGLGIEVYRDLLWHRPYRYHDQTRVYLINDLSVGQSTLVQGTLTNVSWVGRRSRHLLCHVSDDTGSLLLRFFHPRRFQTQALAVGQMVRCFGTVLEGYSGGLEMVHPSIVMPRDEEWPPLAEYLTPVYHTTKGVSQSLLRRLVAQVLEQLEGVLDPLAGYRELAGLYSFFDSVRVLHAPPPDADVLSILSGEHPAIQSLAFEELLAYSVCLQRRAEVLGTQVARSLPADERLVAAVAQLPFDLTGAQKRAVSEIQVDLEKPHPMWRLLQGDVGSGKTAVAVMAMWQAVLAGQQAVLMAPTELLAEQHYQTISRWSEGLDIEVVLLAGRVKGAARQAVLDSVASGVSQIIVGTHAVFQAAVTYHDLGLVVIDEQHRFGVEQRQALHEKGCGDEVVHQLMMSATPIPRTLAMTLYADLSVSILDEMPVGRQPIQTVAIPYRREQEVRDRLKQQCASGSQSYWVCSRIDPVEGGRYRAVETVYAELSKALAPYKVGLIHGRLAADDKEVVMRRFQEGAIHVLVSTTVVEVGVDVPNANLMIIDNAEYFGMVQLHQLRGRVGRGEVESYCVLLYQDPLSEEAQERLRVIRGSRDGFEIAEHDLRLRGSGELLGTQQVGVCAFRIADVVRDQGLFKKVLDCRASCVSARAICDDVLFQRWGFSVESL